MSADIIGLCWAVFRMTFRSFAEGIFIYLLFNNSFSNNLKISRKITFTDKKKIIIFAFVYSSLVLFVVFPCDVSLFYRPISAILLFFYFWYKLRKTNKQLVSNYKGIYDIKYALTTAILLVLAVDSFNLISHMLLHTSLVLTGVYDTVRSIDIFYQLYKTTLMFLDVFFIFLAYKFQVIKMKDIKAMSAYKWVSISFGLCLLSAAYVDHTYYIFYNVPLTDQFRNTLLWTLAFMLPTYWGFYLLVKNQTKLLSIKANYIADANIRVWIFNPSMIEVTHFDIYDSDVFMSKFEAKKLAFKRELDKLGINKEYKGYSELIFCLFLTQLFVGLKGWNFEKDIFGLAALVIDVPLSNLRENIENIIKQVWFKNEGKVLIDNYYFPYHSSNTYNQTQRPTVEQFLTDVAKSI